MGQRESQQDCITQIALSPSLRLFILADGMGGHEAGEIASQTVTQQFAHYFSQHPHHTSIGSHLYQALHFANDALQNLVHHHPQWRGMGTTLLAVCVHENGQFDYISVGDSPLYHLASGSLKRINANHAFAETLAQQVARGEISPEAAAQHPQRHAITSALTGAPIPHIDQHSGSLKTGERLLLASDGVQTLSDEQILLWISQSSVETAVSDLFNAIVAQQQPHQDNASAILIEYGETVALAAPRTIAAPPTLPPSVAWQPEKQSPLKWLLLGGMGAILLGLLMIIMLLRGSETQETVPTAASAVQKNVHVNRNSEVKAASALAVSEAVAVSAVQAASEASGVGQ